ncbi:MAG: SDR family oxidoreductase [Hylemonella sp.]|nr:SDR family oxidoreductase [bacterium]MDP1938657.1 SDR family oxidoreductase [Hylemonella sp.]
MRILVLGVSGMLGNAIFRVMSNGGHHEVFGSARSASVKGFFATEMADNIIAGIDVENTDSLVRLFSRVQPEVVINCIGLVKQLAEANDPLSALPINALLPHRLAHLCELVRARLVHISTDCVFSGRKGDYLETDEADAQDLYGRSKLIGEVDYPHAITLRTSIIGHELNSAHGLIDWFLAQQGSVKGFTRAVFSGLPTCELARVICEYVLPHKDLHGLYHVASQAVSKNDLLEMVNEEYGKGLKIEPDDHLIIDRSLNASRFRETTGYVPPAWPDLIAQMHEFR